MTDVEKLARELYAQRVAERGPAWEQLGEVTRGVWRKLAFEQLYGDLV